MEISIYFHGTPNDKNCKKIGKICAKYDGEFQSGGTIFDDDLKPCRDVQYKVPKYNIEACKKELINEGFVNVK